MDARVFSNLSTLYPKPIKSCNVSLKIEILILCIFAPYINMFDVDPISS